MKTNLRKLIAMSSLFAAGAIPVFSQEHPPGEFDAKPDIGAPKLSGAASYDAANQAYTVSGAGLNMWFTNDQCHFVWKKMQGDFILRTRVEFIGQGAVEHRKIGWIVRPNLDADAPYADCVEHGSGLTSLQFRRAKGANTEEITLSITNADVLQFERKGGTYIFSAAHHGEPFVSAQLPDVDLGNEVYAGLFVCSHNGDVVEKAIFRDVRIIRQAKADFVPYKDYLGSVLEILDVQSGKLEKVYASAQPFEAPNWMKDGHALIYNISGRAEGWGKLTRFDLATKKPSPLNTDPANRNNNDHVLSFDGTMLGISGGRDQSSDARRNPNSRGQHVVHHQRGRRQQSSPDPQVRARDRV